MPEPGEPNGEREAVWAAEDALSRANRAELKLARTRRLEFQLVVMTAVVALTGMFFAGWNTWRTRQFGFIIKDCTTPGGRCYESNRDAQQRFREELQDLIKDVGQCQTLQLLQHRDANEKAHALNAAKHGYVYAAPAGEIPPPIPNELQQACAKFLPPEQGGAR